MGKPIGVNAFSVSSIIKHTLLFAPAAIYFYLVHKDSINLPWEDDYNGILRFLLRFNSAPLKQQLWLLFDQHNEHRILSSRVVFVLYYKLFGGINFTGLKLIADAQLVILCIIVIVQIKKLLPQNWFPAAFVAALCLFDINNWENANFALAGMVNYGAIFLFWCAIMLYNSSNRKYLPFAILLQVVCVFSSGNGIVGSAFIVACTLLNKDRVKFILSSLVFLISTHYIFCTIQVRLPGILQLMLLK